MARRKRLSSARPDFLSSGDEAAPLRAAPAPIAGIAGDAARNAAAAELAQALTEARETGRMVIELPLAAIDAAYLVRDRLGVDEEEMAALVASLAARGQQVPIEVADLGGDRYGLISGWRRIEALRRMGRDTVLALLRTPREAEDAYLAMVEENEIRVGLSHYERARIAVKAVEQGVYPDLGAALRSLFHAASRSKRSKIGSFAILVSALDGHLRHPAAIGERLGLRLAQALDADTTLGAALAKRLDAAAPAGMEAEQALLSAALSPSKSASEPRRAAPDPQRVRVGPGLDYEEGRDGSIRLSGAALNSDFRDDLRSWLEERLRE